MKKVSVLGAGSWGTAQAVLLSRKLDSLVLWGRPEDGIEDMRTGRENTRFLPGVKIPNNIEITSDLEQALDNIEVLILAVPAQVVREVVKRVGPVLHGHPVIVNTAKGIEINTGMRMSQVIEDEMGRGIRDSYAVLSGPSHAEEVARSLPTAVTVAAFKQDTAFLVQDLYMAPFFRVYTNPDVPGVELGGALKNIVALATGIVEGLGYGDNTKAALITRGLTEIIRMGVTMGGDYRTFSGLSGIGDLVVTCGSRLSRNLRAGELIGRGLPKEEVMHQVGMVVEGIHTTRVVDRLANEFQVEMPITHACYNIVFRGKPPRGEVDELMQRQKKHEIRGITYEINEW
ncbi:NAD(P)H-dependent glycerol-3-phosphate dehydrogenase [Syntrophomonas erecta]